MLQFGPRVDQMMSSCVVVFSSCFVSVFCCSCCCCCCCSRWRRIMWLSRNAFDSNIFPQIIHFCTIDWLFWVTVLQPPIRCCRSKHSYVDTKRRRILQTLERWTKHSNRAASQMNQRSSLVCPLKRTITILPFTCISTMILRRRKRFLRCCFACCCCCYC